MFSIACLFRKYLYVKQSIVIVLGTLFYTILSILQDKQDTSLRLWPASNNNEQRSIGFLPY